MNPEAFVDVDRAEIETLADRDDNIGALARIIIAADAGTDPDPDDCAAVEWAEAHHRTTLAELVKDTPPSTDDA